MAPTWGAVLCFWGPLRFDWVTSRFLKVGNLMGGHSWKTLNIRHLNGGYTNNCFLWFPILYVFVHIDESVCGRCVSFLGNPHNHIYHPNKLLIFLTKKIHPFFFFMSNPSDPPGWRTFRRLLQYDLDGISHGGNRNLEVVPPTVLATNCALKHIPFERSAWVETRQLRMYLGQTICFGNIIWFDISFRLTICWHQK